MQAHCFYSPPISYDSFKCVTSDFVLNCSPPDIKQKCCKFISVKFLRNLTSPSQLCILFSVFLFALVFVNTRHRSWPSDFSHFRFCVPSPIHSARTSAVLICPLINTKLRKGNCLWPSCIRSEQDCTRSYNPQKHYLHHKSANNVNNQQDATSFSFIIILKSVQRVSGDRFAHPQEHF